jgi:3-phytase
MSFYFKILVILIVISLSGCMEKERNNEKIQPVIITQKAQYDTDDCAIWINEDDPSESLILGTDKNEDGAILVFNLEGQLLEDKSVKGLKKPNNVDIRKVNFNGKEYPLVVTTERLNTKLRIFKLPDMISIDNGGINVFEGETDNEPMGVSFYYRKSDTTTFVIISRKNGPSGKYLWQYRLDEDESGKIIATKVREFGNYSGNKEIEAVAVDDELGYIYYSDEMYGVRKYYADPEKGDEELAVFAKKGFEGDHEGISIYKLNNGTGYILVSDQKANEFHIYTREGSMGDPHKHKLLKVVDVAALKSDGSEVTNAFLGPLFPNGLFVAMSKDKTFHLYDWVDIAGNDLVIAPDGELLNTNKN